MTIYRNITAIVIAVAIMNIGIMSNAHAAESSWSLDSFYQAINKNVSFSNIGPETQTAVVAQAVPATSKPRIIGSKKTVTVTATAYSSSVDETDDSPFITAKGTFVRDGIIAANFLPFGTAVKIPALYGDKIFVVEDRMNKRFSDRIDLWFPSKQAAYQFGKRTVTIEILS